MTSSLAAGATQSESAAYRRRYIPAYLRSLTRGIRVPIIESAKMTDAAHRGFTADLFNIRLHPVQSAAFACLPKSTQRRHYPDSPRKDTPSVMT